MDFFLKKFCYKPLKSNIRKQKSFRKTFNRKWTQQKIKCLVRSSTSTEKKALPN